MNLDTDLEPLKMGGKLYVKDKTIKLYKITGAAKVTWSL